LGVLATPAQAALITQTIGFSFSNFDEAGTFTPGPIQLIEGSVSFTFDDATPTSIFGQAVDSISFSTPVGVFDTSNVFFDLRIGADIVGPPITQYELDIYHDTLPVFINVTDDFLLQLASVNPVGAPFSNSAGTASLFSYSDGNFGFFRSNEELLNSTSVPATSSVSAPASVAFLGLGMLALGLRRRARR
ncbi:MAG: hypothetical protein ACPGRZ_10535, partial [Alphaproteobacteria bacterium]